MNLYLPLYLLSGFISLYAGIGVWSKYRNISGVFFLLYSIALSLWLMLYYLFFVGNISETTILLLSRINHGISGIGVYFLLFFIYFFEKPPTIKHRKYVSIIGGIAAMIFLVTSISPWMIAGLTLDNTEQVYREIPGILFHGYISIYFIFLVCFSIALISNFRNQNGISRTRILYISIWSILFLCIIITLQVILPLFGIWILERGIVIFFALYSLGILYIVRKYAFVPLWYDISQVLSITFSGILSLLLLNYLKHWVPELSSVSGSFWGRNDTLGITSFVLSVSLFFGIYYILSHYIFGKIFFLTITHDLENLEKEIDATRDIEELNTLLGSELPRILDATYGGIILIEEKERKNHISSNYFGAGSKGKYFINDPAFSEKLQESFPDFFQYISSFSKKPHLLYPLKNHKDTDIGFLNIGVKKFGNTYNMFEIDELKKLALFLSRHLSYIETYTSLDDISRNLDRRIDEKTIKYNTLISRQKDFISTLSHEIRTPVTSVILQLDNLLDDIDSRNATISHIKKELQFLSEHLVGTGELLTRLFSAEYLDRPGAILYPKTTNMSKLIRNQYLLLKKVHNECLWHDSIEDDLGYVHIDNIQFTQVIGNLLNNALKFSNKIHPEILIEAKRDGENIFIAIEDNGKGMKNIQSKDIFEKYITGKNSASLGIGLYLCRRIIDLHHGDIIAKKGNILGGMRIEIHIPINS